MRLGVGLPTEIVNVESPPAVSVGMYPLDSFAIQLFSNTQYASPLHRCFAPPIPVACSLCHAAAVV